MSAEPTRGDVARASVRGRALVTCAWLCLGLCAGLSFWCFSRFTVDDAFITWRYGKNLIDANIWGYNPTHTDLTQAYTNPLYALLSIIPHWIGVDVVLFFKLLSLTFVVLFGLWFSRVARAGLTILFFYALPATCVHAFSGLETFSYVALMTVLLISLVEDKRAQSLVVTLLLCVTRPEAWTLLVLVPIFFALPTSLDQLHPLRDRRALVARLLERGGLEFKGMFWAALFLWLPMSAYFYVHADQFGYALPNTFYIKSYKGFNLINFVVFALFALPLCALLWIGKLRVFLVSGAFFAAVVLSYATSSLQMNYVDRFTFHIAVPVALTLCYLSARTRDQAQVASPQTQETLNKQATLMLRGAVLSLALFGLKSSAPMGLAHIANYYPRALDAHAALGKVLGEDGRAGVVKVMALGDAGMTAYHAGLPSLDVMGLGSALVAHRGLVDETINAYNPDLLIFYARAGEIKIRDFRQAALLRWSSERQYQRICEVYWRPDYTLMIYAPRHHERLLSICASSQARNQVDDLEYLVRHIWTAPWAFWRI